MVFKMITLAACEGPCRCVAVEQNPLPCLPSIFNLAPDKLHHQHKNMAVLQLIGLEKYENLRKTWFADWIGINDFLKISTLANWATQKDLWPHILSDLSGCMPKKKANKSWYWTSDGAAIISLKCMYMCNLHTITSVNLTWLKLFVDEAAVTVF